MWLELAPSSPSTSGGEMTPAYVLGCSALHVNLITGVSIADIRGLVVDMYSRDGTLAIYRLVIAK